MRDRIHEIITDEIEKGNLVGANISILKNGNEVYYNEFGLADRERNIPMKRDTIIRLYSMSKPITAAAAMLLFERGEIDLFTPISKYLPSFKNQKVDVDGTLVDAKREVTIRDLLNMTSGIVYPDVSTKARRHMQDIFDEYIDEAYKGKAKSTYEFCNRMGECSLAYHPGEQWNYGASADVLGALIEVVAGKKYGEFLKEEFFEPLGMVDTDFYVPEEKVGRFAQNYIYCEEQKKLVPYLGNNLALIDFTRKPAFESGGAGIVSTIEDYTKFALMLLNEGEYQGKRYLSKQTVQFMRTCQLSIDQQNYLDWDSLQGYGYGNFMRILKDRAKAGTNGSIGEYGWDGWTGNYLTINPEENLVMLYFIQRCNTGFNEVTRRLRSVVYGAMNDSFV